jgi:hypothetical protein
MVVERRTLRKETMNKITAAYIAGIMDGEGCFYLERFASKRYTNTIGFQYRIMATVTMCDKKTIDFICSNTGKNFRVKKLKSGRTAYVVDFRNSIAAAFIRQILPFLQGKKEQAELCLYFNEHIAPGRGRSHIEGAYEKCESIRLKLQELKR